MTGFGRSMRGTSARRVTEAVTEACARGTVRQLRSAMTAPPQQMTAQPAPDPHRGAGLRHRLPAGPRQAAGGRRLAAPRAGQPRPARRHRRHAPQRARHRPRGARPAGLDLPREALRAAPRPRRRRLHGPLVGRPARARAAAGRRRLDHEAVPPGGAHRAGRGGRAPAQARRAAGRGRPGRRRRGRDPRRTSSRPSWAASAPTSRGASSSSSSCSPTRRGRCSSARRSTSACGATRWCTATAPSTCSCASCARSSSGCRRDWRYIHTHFGIGYRFAAEPVDAVVEADAAAVGVGDAVGCERSATRSLRRDRGRGRVAAEPAAVEQSPAPERGAGYRSGSWARTATRTSATPRSSSCSRSPCGSCRAAAPRPRRSATCSASIFAGGIVFFGYRMYMEHRSSLFMLEDKTPRAALRLRRARRVRADRDGAAVGPGRHRRAHLARAARRRRVRARHGLPHVARVLRSRRAARAAARGAMRKPGSVCGALPYGGH